MIDLDLPMKLDLDLSLVRLGERTYPACLLVCPDDEEYPELDRWNRHLGGDFRLTMNAIIPTESGVCVNVDMDKSTGLLYCTLMARTCYRSHAWPDDIWMWLPHSVTYNGIWNWPRCELWWLIEHIERVAQMNYEEPEGPHCELVRLDHFGDRDAL
jgi:hypothetical protein